VFLLGILLVLATGSWSAVCFLYDDNDDGEPNILQRWCYMCDADDHAQMTLLDHVRYTIRALVCILGQVGRVAPVRLPLCLDPILLSW
jgi:hypothetical protein